MKGNAISFLFGAALGAAATYYFTRGYFQRIADEEIESVRDTLINRADTAKEEIDYKEGIDVVTTPEKPETMAKNKDAYTKAVVAYNKMADKEPEIGPEIISEDEFGEESIQVTWTYYPDGVVTDEMDNIVHDYQESIGTDFVNHFENGVVHIRNSARHCEYEVLEENEEYYATHKSGV